MWCIVPAAGSGRRFGGDKPKQYQALAGKPILLRTLERLADHPRISGLVVVLAPDDEHWFGINTIAGKAVVAVAGGTERMHSVLAGLGALPAEAHGGDWVLIHDGVRPLVTYADIDRLIEEGARHAHGALLGAPVFDTVKEAGAGGVVARTLPRDRLWRALTPQLFRKQDLQEALAAAAARGEAVTDEAMAMERVGKPPLLVSGDADNIKITTQRDLALANWLLARS